ncbi:prepilin peptidase [Pseudodesulfovibrio tunisiensis]|uniref:prepilin peptidase n=1 Tax=Pseudodesulfovibrio tunisiensis TaxID=463192 RepID=UPI001FB2FC65|nr:A24 family peptidase [Pseudodesulfovibrio tunisiensis]
MAEYVFPIPQWIFLVAAAVAGLELGGIATVFIHRWIAEQPIFRPFGSTCPYCENRLEWRDTIPLISYLLLRGRCRHCNMPIGPRYVLTELACCALSVALAHQFGPTLSWLVYLVFGVMLASASFIDFETFLLPDRITLGGTALALGAGFVLPRPGWEQAVLGALVGAGMFWILQQGYKLLRGQDGLGTGDVKLMGFIGAIVGVQGLPFTILAGGIAGLAGSLAYMVRPGAKGVQTRVPFGPFLSLGCLLYLLLGPSITLWWRY